MIYYLLGLGAAALGWKLFSDSKTAQPQVTPAQAAVSANPYQVGQTVKVPLNQLPANVVPASTLAAFQLSNVQGLIVTITSLMTGAVAGNLISTYDANGGRIGMPVPVPVVIPTSLIIGLA